MRVRPFVPSSFPPKWAGELRLITPFVYPDQAFGFTKCCRACLGVVLAEELRRLGRTLRKPGFLKDRRDLRIRGEALPTRLVPIEDRPNPVALIWIPKNVRPLATVLLSLLGALG